MNQWELLSEHTGDRFDLTADPTMRYRLEFNSNEVLKDYAKHLVEYLRGKGLNITEWEMLEGGSNPVKVRVLVEVEDEGTNDGEVASAAEPGSGGDYGVGE